MTVTPGAGKRCGELLCARSVVPAASDSDKAPAAAPATVEKFTYPSDKGALSWEYEKARTSEAITQRSRKALDR
jgi:hypothetical protein